MIWSPFRLPASGVMQHGAAPVRWQPSSQSSGRKAEDNVELRYSNDKTPPRPLPARVVPRISRGVRHSRPNGTYSVIAVDSKDISSVTVHGLNKLPGPTVG